MNTDKDLASIIGVYLNKYEAIPNYVDILDFEFKVKAFYDIQIYEKSINPLKDGSIQFNGKSKIYIIDPESSVSTNNEAIFSGIAFFEEDSTKKLTLHHIDLYNIKLQNQFSQNNKH